MTKVKNIMPSIATVGALVVGAKLIQKHNAVKKREKSLNGRSSEFNEQRSYIQLAEFEDKSQYMDLSEFEARRTYIELGVKHKTL